MTTNIQVSDQVWEALNRRKQRGDTFDDVLRRELGLADTAAAEPAVPVTESSHDREQPPATHPEPDRDLLDAVDAYLADHPPRTQHGKAAVRELARVLAERGPLSVGACQDHLIAHGDLDDHYDSGRGLWNSLSRYFDDVPGVYKSDYGEWDVEWAESSE